MLGVCQGETIRAEPLAVRALRDAWVAFVFECPVKKLHVQSKKGSPL